MDNNQQSRETADEIRVAAEAAPAGVIEAGGNGTHPEPVQAMPPQAAADAPAEDKAAPDAPAVDAPKADGSGASEAAPAEAKLQPVILYVEDDMLSREVMRLLLQKELGYTELTIIDDNTDFMDKVRALGRVPDVIFLDIQMRPYDGYQMLEMLRADEAYRDCQIIAMTASVMATDVEALKKAGFSGLIGKPIMRQAFPDQLEQILAGKAVWFVS